MVESVFCSVPARIGFLGNPSDGYFGSCISVPLLSRVAKITLTSNSSIFSSKTPTGDPLHSIPSDFSNIDSSGNQWPDDADLQRILGPTLIEFERWSGSASRSFCCAVETTIPRQVGLAGSSAIETALFRALVEWNGIAAEAICGDELAAAVQRVETEHLGMVAGLQDRLPQAHEAMLYMDFERRAMQATGRATSTVLDTALLPPLWLAFGPRSTDSGEVHSKLPERWSAGDAEMIRIIADLKRCADAGVEALLAGKVSELPNLIDLNFDLRRELFGDAALGDTLRIVEFARSLGSSAKQTGSGGAIFGTIPPDESNFIENNQAKFAELGWTLEVATV
jgi:glucuronokinase